MTRSERRDLAFLALLLLAFGFVLAPLLHRVKHGGHGHSHHHLPSTPKGSRHGEGTLEHQLVAFTEPTFAIEPAFFAVVAAAPRSARRRFPQTQARWTTELPQGP
jgi:hypothetical protein